MLNLKKKYILDNSESEFCQFARLIQLSKQVREVNLVQEGDSTHFGQELTDCHIQRVWSELLQKCDYEGRRQQVDSYNRSATQTISGTISMLSILISTLISCHLVELMRRISLNLSLLPVTVAKCNLYLFYCKSSTRFRSRTQNSE